MTANLPSHQLSCQPAQERNLPNRMSLLAQTPMIGADREVHADSSPFVTVRLLQAISRFVETRGWVAFAAVSSVCGWIRLGGFAPLVLDHPQLSNASIQ